MLTSLINFDSYLQAIRMIPFEQAKKIAEWHLNESRTHFQNTHPGDDLILVKVVEFSDGWLFFFNSKNYHETKNFLYNLIGLGPVIVDNKEGYVYQAGSGRTEGEWIDEFNEFLQRKNS